MHSRLLFRFFLPVLLAVCCGKAAKANASDTANPACRKDARVIAPCFRVHGRLSNWNGNPTRRIWMVGTKRMLGLRDDTALPPALEKQLGNFDQEVFGDFEFCPFTREKAGAMQVGCVAEVANYSLKKRTP